MDPGRGQNRTGGSLLQRTSSSDRKATATYWMHSSDLEAFGKKCCYFWFHWKVKFLTHFGRFLGHRSQSDLLWSRVVRRPSVVRPASVRRPLNYLHFRLLLQNRLMDFDETWYGWSTQGLLQVLLFFGQIRPWADPGQGKNRSRGSPSSGNFFFRPEDYSNKPNA